MRTTLFTCMLLASSICVGHAAEEDGEKNTKQDKKEEEFALDLFETDDMRARLAADCARSGGDEGDDEFFACGPVLQFRFQR